MTFKQLLTNAKRALRLIRILNYNPATNLGPLCMDVAVTSKCNYQCYFCATHSSLKDDADPGETMPEEMARRLFADFAALGVREVLLSGNGEPLMFSFIRQLVIDFGKRIRVKALTNGSSLHAVTPELFASLDKLTISLNSITPATHQQIHGYKGANQLSGIIQNIERLLDLPSARDKIQVNYVMTSDNFSEFDELITLSQKWDIQFSIRPINVGFKALEPKKVDTKSVEMIRDKVEQHLQKDGWAARALATLHYARDAFALRATCKTDGLAPCYAGFFWGNIWSNGDYTQCVGVKTPLGNIRERSFAEIWQDPATQAKLYEAALIHETNQPVYPQCYGCETGQIYSSLFHKIFSRIPGQVTRLRQWNNLKRFSPPHP